MFNMSASQGQRFAECAREMTERIRSLGPSPARKKISTKDPGKEISEVVS